MNTGHKQRLEGLSEKIFLDRYAWKDADTNNTKVGDVVLVLTKDDPKFPAKEVGEVVERNGRFVSVKLRSGEVVQSTVEKLTLTIEKTPEEMWDRLAAAMASVEPTPEKQNEWTEKFRYILDDWKLVPGGRIAAGAGASEELTLFNCYVIPSPKDSRGGIMETLSEMTEIMARGGGVGINLSSLRPRRAIVRGVNGSSSGAVSWGGLFSYTTGLIEQGGSRRGALMLMMNDWHPDVVDFITVKQTMGQVTNANLSVCVSNGFMKAVKEDLDWELVFPDTSDPEYDELWDGDLDKWKQAGKAVIPYRTVKAREIWHTIIESAWKSAEPGVVFMEYYNQMSNSWYFNPIICTNPCGEQGLPAWGVCNLSALNLSKFYDEEKHDVAWDELSTVTRYAVRFLDNVIDKTPYHFEENKENQQNERRVGLGSMGLAELMIKLGIRYGSPESLEFLDKLFGFIARESYLASAEIAGEKGAFPAFETEPYLQSGFMKNMLEVYPEVGEAIRRQGMRNVTVITQAPTGSTGTMVGTSTGIEPYFAFKYFRQSRLGFDEQFVPIAQEWMDAHPGQELPDYFITAMDLSAEDHIRAQAAIQRWVDSSISKTANCPNDFTVEETKRLYELAFDLGCKGVTIYRDGSRDVQVLSTDKGDNKEDGQADQTEAGTPAEEAAEASAVPVATQTAAPNNPAGSNVYKRRPQVLRGATYKVNTPFGMAYITINDMNGIPGEIFLNVGKAGSDVFAMAEALGRVCSLFLRYGDHGNKVELLIKHLKGIGGSGAIGFGANRVESIADAVAKALEIHQQEALGLGAETDPAPIAATIEAPVIGLKESGSASASRDLCPSCGTASLLNVEGCKTCANCGYSRCS
ncbi:adenosylcobalamin-dependent ribonucleoside-diphosphate reductase [Paenibacillus thiaminolyticus]|uniref:adenosylcobalamin-dependent ribonucleoside-diphosphate reductase n=1 Tax=Paenibacillus thiaminolyticus TaxID=49283 RepID=UPI0011641E14|nr:adenosylcobalamin-dependent ribonucleoside-diphosphate reductase [Paenibacillus thiaminolyticus]NGP57330.1 adenosylcobalamin-dependent ribonucleoside-diphosphate reductase [Paenibacillus thiaminolyticus]WCR27476.1 adenosylcobalamin-dependent ribonucleoside-diphosphate reductase [Paenibacillus thiaminolyticus]